MFSICLLCVCVSVVMGGDIVEMMQKREGRVERGRSATRIKGEFLERVCVTWACFDFEN